MYVHVHVIMYTFPYFVLLVTGSNNTNITQQLESRLCLLRVSCGAGGRAECDDVGGDSSERQHGAAQCCKSSSG